MRSKWIAVCLPLVGALSLTGCSVGAGQIRANYADYNETIHYNHSQEMLLNLVRSKYRESPLFLKVGTLSTSYTFAVGGSADGGRRFGEAAYGVAYAPSFSERPTITYSPVEGNTFVTQLLSELDPATFVLLYRSGWPIDQLCHIAVERIGPTSNDVDRPTYDRFTWLVDRLADAQDRDLLEFFEDADGKIYIGIRESVGDLAELTIDDFEVQYAQVVPFSVMQLRSFSDIMFFLGQAARVPDAHSDRVRFREPNEWLNIHWSEKPPDNAMVWVRYGGYHFYVLDTDVKSKDTFALLKMLYQIQAGDIESVQPVLTLSAD